MPEWGGQTNSSPYWRPLAWLRALVDSSSDLKRALRRRDPADETPAHELDLLLRVRGWLERLEAVQVLNQNQKLIKGWAEFRLRPLGKSHCLAAAEAFAEVSKRPLEKLEFLREILLGSAAAAYLRAGRAEVAERFLRERVNVSSTKADDAMDLLLCCHLVGDEDATLSALELYISHRPDDADGEELPSIALQFGLLAKERSNLHTLLATAAMEAPKRAEGEAIVQWLDPWFAQLTPRARSKWWAALCTLSTPGNEAKLGDELWSQVATFFVEAMNLELRYRVWEPFAKVSTSLRNILQREKLKPKEQLSLLSGRGSPGQSLYALIRVAQPSDEFTRQLAQWLSKERPKLVEYLRAPGIAMRLEELRQLRNSGVHDSIDRAGAYQAFVASRAILRRLYAKQSA